MAVPLGIRVLLPAPTFLSEYTSVKFAVSPETSGPPAVIVGVAAALVVPSYPLLFVAAVTVIGFWFTVSVFVPLLAVKLASTPQLALPPVRKVLPFIFF